MLESSSIFTEGRTERIATLEYMKHVTRILTKGNFTNIEVNVSRNGLDYEKNYQLEDSANPNHGKVRLILNPKQPFLSGFYQQVGKDFYTENGIDVPAGNQDLESFFIDIFSGDVYSGDNVELTYTAPHYDINSITISGATPALVYSGIMIIDIDQLHITALPAKSYLEGYIIEKLSQTTFKITSEVVEDLNVEVNINQIYQYNNNGMITLEVLNAIAHDFLHVI